jgi:hypothetical protein
LRTTPKISIALEGECWRDVLREISIIQASVTGSRIEDLPDKGIVAPDERSGQDGPKKSFCANCGCPLDHYEFITYGVRFCSKSCADLYDNAFSKLNRILAEYHLGPEERAEILERVRQ